MDKSILLYFMFSLGFACAVGYKQFLLFPMILKDENVKISHKLYSGDTSLSKMFSFLCIIWAIVMAFMTFTWYSPIIVILFGYVLALVFYAIFRGISQFIFVAGIYIVPVVTHAIFL